MQDAVLFSNRTNADRKVNKPVGLMGISDFLLTERVFVFLKSKINQKYKMRIP